MELSAVVRREFEAVESHREVSTVVGAFTERGVKAVVVTDDGDYAGMVTRRELVSSHRPPGQKVGPVTVTAPTLTEATGVREAARLMIESGIHVLPVVEDGEAVGTVAAIDLLELVGDRFDVFAVADVYTLDLVTVRLDTPFGRALARFRDHGITHLPVVEDDDVVGVVSLTDVLGVTVREETRVPGGSAAGAGNAPQGVYQSQSGGRAVERDRALELPVRAVMTAPVATIGPEAGLSEAVERMRDRGVSSLVVDDAEGPTGIVTTTDALEALSREPDDPMSVQVTNADLLGDVGREEVAALVERTARKHAALDVIEATVHLHEHRERRHGTSLLLARVRLYTDDGSFVVSGEGFGARDALRAANAKLERKLLDDKGHRRAALRRKVP